MPPTLCDNSQELVCVGGGVGGPGMVSMECHSAGSAWHSHVLVGAVDSLAHPALVALLVLPDRRCLRVCVFVW